MTSLRRRLSAYLLLGVGGLLVATALVLSLVISPWQEGELESTLLAKARALETFTKLRADHVELDFADQFMPEFQALENPEYFELWLGDGSVLKRSNSLRAQKIEGDLLRDVLQTSEVRFQDLDLPDGRRGRLVQIRFEPQVAHQEKVFDEERPRASSPKRHHTVSLVVAKSREDLDRRLRIFHFSLVAVILLLLGAIAVLVNLSLRIGLRPLDEVTQQVQGLDARTLDARLRIPSPPAELLPVIDQLNALLERLQQAFDRERRLSSNVAHELRTPIAELRNLAEVGSNWPDQREMVLQFFDDVRAISMQMEKTVSHLLVLARFDSGLEIVRNTLVHLEEAVDTAWRHQAREAAKKNIVLALDVPTSLTLRTDPDKLELMLLNLLGNAINYSPRESTIRCFAQERDEGIALTVTNPAEHLQQEDVPMLFDRFWRKDPARTGGQHTGLGLALVRAFAELLGIGITVALDNDGCLHFKLIFTGKPDQK
jgi:two-component system sensor histidine kinase QseC